MRLELKERILLISNTGGRGKILASFLEEDNYSVRIASDLASAYEIIESNKFDGILVDLESFGNQALDLIHSYRHEENQPVCFCIGSSEDPQEIIDAYKHGADSVVPASCALRELQLKLRSFMKRRRQQIKNNILVSEDIMLKPEEREVSKGKKSIKLTVSECKILSYMLSCPNKEPKINELLELMSGSKAVVSESAVKQRIKFMKEKLATIGAEDLLFGGHTPAVLAS